MSHVAGFSLIELIISMAILSVGLFAGIRVFPVGLGASKRAEMRSRAAFAAQRTIESLKLTPWEDLATGETTTETDGFGVTTRISQPEREGLVDAVRLKAVEVRVAWTQDGRTRQISFVTYLRQPSS
jgi:prepilin-type N-terminal cleavage/methylation domain-containing protein